MDRYDQLREMLDANPAVAPMSKAFDEILRLLFTPEEIDVALAMSFRALPVESIARAAGLAEDETGRRLEAMADKAVIFAKTGKDGKKTYGLVPTIPGLFEFPFMKGGGTPMHERLAKLWEEYHGEALGKAFSGNPTPLMRVVPVGESLVPENRVHPYEEISSLIKNSRYLAVTKCACRVSVGKCDHEKEVCLIFDGAAEFLWSAVTRVNRGRTRGCRSASAREGRVWCKRATTAPTGPRSSATAALLLPPGTPRNDGAQTSARLRPQRFEARVAPRAAPVRDLR